MAALAILQIINNAAAANGVPAQLAVAQAQQESSLNPAAYNAKSGATGLFQLEPPTAAQLGVTNSLDPVQNSNGGTKYLAQLYAQFGTWGLALAAFDWGPGNLQNALNTYGDNWFSHAPAETQNYVTTILQNAGMDASVSITPSSVITGAVSAVQNMIFPVPDETVPDDSAEPAPVPGGAAGLSLAQISLLTAAGVGVYLLAELLAD